MVIHVEELEEELDENEKTNALYWPNSDDLWLEIAQMIKVNYQGNIKFLLVMVKAQTKNIFIGLMVVSHFRAGDFFICIHLIVGYTEQKNINFNGWLKKMDFLCRIFSFCG